MPAIYYGRKQKSTSVVFPVGAFLKVWKTAGESAVVTLKDGKDELDSLIYAVDKHPLTGLPRHADFYVFEKGQKLKVNVPIEFIGVAPAVKDKGGVLVKVLREIHIEAEPKNLPHKIEIDISPLVDFGSQILAKNVKLPAGVTLQELPEEVVASVYEPKEEVVEVAAPTIDDIEVAKKGKEAKEGEEGAAAEPAAAGAKKEDAKKEAPKKEAAKK
jgi:large subunit ribosomal protein L25